MSRSTDETRLPLQVEELRRTVLRPESLWTSLEVVDEIGSTNTELAAQARAGAPEGAVLIAERQTAGRGRLDRIWQSPPRAGIAMSVLLRPAVSPISTTRSVPLSRYGWLPLLAGVALAEAVDDPGGLNGGLKWPNDLLVGGRKCAGILAEVADGAVVIGVGLNVSLRSEELPRPDATSLFLEGAASVDREVLIGALLRRLEGRYREWVATGGDPAASGLITKYRERCVTIGRSVRVELPSGNALTGTATDVDDDGRLVIENEGSRITVAAGDVIHIR